jgi:uncharacterized iron-regulated protein
MNKKAIALLVLVTTISMGFKQDNHTYKVYDIKGKESTYQDIIKLAKDADIVFIGELHNNPISHWLELEITGDLFLERGTDVILGAEMFERDDQLIIDEYLSGLYASDKFEPEVKLWNNYKTDYRPLLEFSKNHKLSFIATNIPRRYASMVNKGGFESLDTLTIEAKRYIAPLPIPYDPEIKSYKDIMEMGGEHATENMPKAQASKDATMAWSIVESISDGKIFIHYNGSYHSTIFEGIVWYLNQYKPGLKIVTIETVSQKDINSLEDENIGVANFVIAIPDNMTKTY